jgi:uncharacterized membrane protein
VLQISRPGPADSSYSARDVSPNGNIMVGYEYSNSMPSAIRWTNGTPANLGAGSLSGTSADGAVVVGDLNGVATVWNATGAHTLASLLGTTSDLTGWALAICNGVSDDGKVVVGQGKHNGVQEGFIAHLP